jgi:ubiquinone/menaquinone biosynthesis C-methylase UbiE
VRDTSSCLRRMYYDLFSKFYDPVIRLHSKDREGNIRRFLVEETNLAKGDRALDLCTGTGSVAAALAGKVGETGVVVGLDFSAGMLRKAKEKAEKLNLGRMFLVESLAHQLPFKDECCNSVTCSHALYELKGRERPMAIDEVARVLKKGGRFCLMEHARPEKPFLRMLFFLRMSLCGGKGAKKFLAGEESFLGKRFSNLRKEMSQTGQSKLLCAEKKG